MWRLIIGWNILTLSHVDDKDDVSVTSVPSLAIAHPKMTNWKWLHNNIRMTSSSHCHTSGGALWRWWYHDIGICDTIITSATLSRTGSGWLYQIDSICSLLQFYTITGTIITYRCRRTGRSSRCHTRTCRCPPHRCRSRTGQDRRTHLQHGRGSVMNRRMSCKCT